MNKAQSANPEICALPMGGTIQKTWVVPINLPRGRTCISLANFGFNPFHVKAGDIYKTVAPEELSEIIIDIPNPSQYTLFFECPLGHCKGKYRVFSCLSR